MSERRIYLATSALAAENFDAYRTIEEASKHGFYGVQLYINPDFYQPGYTTSLNTALRDKQLSLIVHLPNLPNKTDIKVTSELAEHVPDSLALVHYQPLTQLPQIRGITIGWENSVNAPEIDHVVEVREHVKKDETFFVFDYGRLMITDQEETKRQIRHFIETTLSQLRPKKDVIHLADKTSWDKKFRECPCAFGQGVVSEFLPQVKDFVTRGGRVVFEDENLQMAIDGLRSF